MDRSSPLTYFSAGEGGALSTRSTRTKRVPISFFAPVHDAVTSRLIPGSRLVFHSAPTPPLITLELLSTRIRPRAITAVTTATGTLSRTMCKIIPPLPSFFSLTTRSTASAKDARWPQAPFSISSCEGSDPHAPSILSWPG